MMRKLETLKKLEIGARVAEEESDHLGPVNTKFDKIVAWKLQAHNINK
jgi:hypothetical protein